MSNSERTLKIVLMTKNEKYLIKHWIEYHGYIFGYENLYILDDSDDIDVLNYYKSIQHLHVNIIRENNNLNTVINNINKTFNENKNSCDFIIKMDTDEFMGIYDKNTNDISIDKETIRNYFNNLIINGNKYKCSYTTNSLPMKDEIYPINYCDFITPWFTPFKTFFYSKTFESIDLGSHFGTVISPYDSSTHNDTDIIIIHYHNQSAKQVIDNNKRAVYSHNIVNETDDVETKIKTLSTYRGPSVHKAEGYHAFLTDPNYEENYYNIFINHENKLHFDKLKNFFSKSDESIKKCIVITTINKPSSQVLHYTTIKGWDLIIVGDSKTDDSSYDNVGCVYLGLSQQKELFPTFYEKIPIKSYTRKMFGYLYAIKNGYDIIYDTDDDNKYIEKLDNFNNMTTDSGIIKSEKLCSTPGFVNLYKIYSESNIWPRGIPPSHFSIHNEPVLNNNNTNMNIAIIQGLVDNDPDVDAHYRLAINNNPFCFDKNKDIDVILDKYSVCPFNSQNTFWLDKSLFYTMYFPTTVTFRYTDILRGFVALYQLWKNDKTIKFTFSSAVQDRNEHDLIKDYESEVPMYKTAEKVIELLNDNKNATLYEIYEIFSKNGIVDVSELDTLNEWNRLIGGLI